MTANEYMKSIQDNFDGIEKNLDKLSKKEIDTMLNALAEGEDFPENQPVKGDLISRRAAIDAFQMFREYESNRTNAEWVKMIETVLNKLPSIHMGKWLRTCVSGTLYCSECDEVPKIQRETAKCPNCGAKMEVSE